MSDTAFQVIVVIMFIISNIQTFLIFGILCVISKNTEWGRNILPLQAFQALQAIKGEKKYDTEREDR